MAAGTADLGAGKHRAAIPEERGFPGCILTVKNRKQKRPTS